MLTLTTKDYAAGVRRNLQDAQYENTVLRSAVNTLIQSLAVISDKIESQRKSMAEALARVEVIIRQNSLPEPETATDDEGEDE